MSRYRAVIVGAGALGLGSLAERLANDYDLYLADITPNQTLLRQIEADQRFTVNLCSLRDVVPRSVTGSFKVILIDTPDGRPEFAQALREADLVLTATGRRLLDDVVAAVAPALKTREEKAWLLFCENGRNIAASYASSVGNRIVTVDTVMSRMCRFDGLHQGKYAPLWSGGDKALVVEDHSFMPLDAGLCDSGPFTSVFSLVSGAEFLLWEDIKQYMHNGMHAFVSYHAFLEGARLLIDSSAWIRREARRVMFDEVIRAIIRTHSFAAKKDIAAYGSDLLRRFFNPFFADTVERGIRGVADKLAPDGRLVGGCRYIKRAGIEPRGYASTIQAAREITRRQSK